MTHAGKKTPRPPLSPNGAMMLDAEFFGTLRRIRCAVPVLFRSQRGAIFGLSHRSSQARAASSDAARDRANTIRHADPSSRLDRGSHWHRCSSFTFRLEGGAAVCPRMVGNGEGAPACAATTPREPEPSTRLAGVRFLCSIFRGAALRVVCLTATGEGGKVEAVFRAAVATQELQSVHRSGPRWSIDCHQNVEVGTCRASGVGTPRRSARSGPFFTAWVAVSDFMSQGSQDGRMLFFRDIAPSLLCTVVSGTVTRTAGLRIRPRATSTSGRGNLARTSTGIAGPLRPSSNLAGVSLPSGNVRFRPPPDSVLACRGFFAGRVHHPSADTRRL